MHCIFWWQCTFKSIWTRYGQKIQKSRAWSIFVSLPSNKYVCPFANEVSSRHFSDSQDFLYSTLKCYLKKKKKKIFWDGMFVLPIVFHCVCKKRSVSFCLVFVIMYKLSLGRPKLCGNCLSTKFPHQDIRWNYNIWPSVCFVNIRK